MSYEAVMDHVTSATSSADRNYMNISWDSLSQPKTESESKQDYVLNHYILLVAIIMHQKLSDIWLFSVEHYVFNWRKLYLKLLIC